MKNLEMNKSAKRILVSGVLAASLFFTAQSSVLANNGKNVVTVAAEEDNSSSLASVSVNYIGMQDRNFMFHVNLNSSASNSIVLTITDESGETLYSTKIENKDYSKTFAVPENLGLQKVNFIVRTNVATNDGSVTTDRVKTFDVTNLSAK